MFSFIIKRHLPESTCEVQGRKIVELALPMSPMHSWISFKLYLSICSGYSTLWNLEQSVDLALFLWNTENWWIVERVWTTDDTKTKPFSKCLFDKSSVSVRNFKLFSVHWILVLEINFVFEILGQAQIVFVCADCILILVKERNVFSFICSGTFRLARDSMLVRCRFFFECFLSNLEI